MAINGIRSSGLRGTGYGNAPGMGGTLGSANLPDPSMAIQQATARLPQQQEPAEPEADPSLLRQAADKSLSGLSMVGNLLDLPGSMVRDALTWLPGGIEASNPFDQLLSPFSDANRTSGEDILKNAGLYSQDNRDDGFAKTAGKFIGSTGLEIALDPLTYLTLGASAVGKGGKLAKAAGLYDDAAKVASRKLGKEVGKRVAKQNISARELAQNVAGDEGLTRLVDGYNGLNARAIKQGTMAPVKSIDEIPAELLDEAIGGNMRWSLPGVGEKIINDITLPGAQYVGAGLDAIGNIAGSVPIPRMGKTLGDVTPDWIKSLPGAVSQGSINGEKIAELGDNVAEAVRYGKYSPVMLASPYFSRAVRGAKTAFGQKEISEVSRRIEEQSQLARDASIEAIKDMHAGGYFKPDEKIVGKTPEETLQLRSADVLARSNVMSDYLEGVTSELPKHLAPAKTSLDRIRTLYDELDNLNREFAVNTQSLGDIGIRPRQLDEAGNVLLDEAGNELFDDAIPSPFKYAARNRQNATGPLWRAIHNGRRVSSKDGFGLAREDYTRHVPTSVLQQMSIDPQFAGVYDQGVMGRRGGFKDWFKGTPDTGKLGSTPVDADAREALRGEFFKKYNPTAYIDPKYLRDEKVVEALNDRHSQLFDSIVELNHDQASKGVPMYAVNPAENLLHRLDSGYMTIASTQGARDIVSKMARLRPGSRFAEGGGTAPITPPEIPATPATVSKQYSGKSFDVGGGSPPARGLVPTIVNKGRIFYGSPGDTHADVIRKYDELDLEEIANADESVVDTTGFASTDGRQLSREEALAFARGEYPDVADIDGQLDSADYAIAAEGQASSTLATPTAINPGSTPKPIIGDSGSAFNLSKQVEEMGMNYDEGKAALLKSLGPDAQRIMDTLDTERVDAAADSLRDIFAKAMPNDPIDDADLVDALRNDRDSVRSIINEIDDKDLADKALGHLNAIDKPINPDDVLREFEVDAELGQDVANVNKAFTGPEESTAYAAAFDAVTNLFKGSVTAPFPSFHVRNAMSAFTQNALNGIHDPTQTGLKKFSQPYVDAKDLMSGKVIKDASQIPLFQRQGLDDKQATEEIRRLIFSRKIVDSPGDHNDIVGNLGGSVADQLIGSTPFKERIKRPEGVSMLDSITPWKTPGVSGGENAFAPVRVGRVVGDVTEQAVRSAPFIALLKQGIDPDEAARQVKRLHVDYGDLTDVERKRLRRAIPFYGFTKGATKYLASELAQNPGGAVAMSIKGAENASGDDPGAPSYIRGGMNIPLGANADGGQEYLVGAGLMHEPPMQMIGPSIPSTLFNFGSMLHPAIKLPIELATNESLFQEGPDGGGRSTDDMDPLLGRTLSNVANTLHLSDRKAPYRIPGGKLAESMISNSPVARLLHQVRKATDPRKSLTTKAIDGLTGFKIATVDPEDSDAVLREQAESLMRELGGRDFSHAYIPDSVIATLEGDELAKAKQLQELLKMLNNRQRARSTEIPAGPLASS